MQYHNINIPSFLPPLSHYINLVSKQDREFFLAYVKWFYLLAKRGLRLKNTNFKYLYKAISKEWSNKRLLGYLQQEFIKRNMSLSLLLEPIEGFDWLSKNRYKLSFSTMGAMMLQVVAPFSRFIAVTNNQKPPFYQPFSNLLFIYIAIYSANIPEIALLFKNNSIEIDIKSLDEQLLRLHNEAKQVLSVTYILKNRLKIAYLLGLSLILIKKHQQKQKNKIEKLDYVNAFLYGLWYMLKSKDKTKGLNQI
ncbi:MAG: hypothetical protein IJE43_03110 [Alphaproteobacteria bacterium]|nr:hypothetical protein [Alphaproteobacteria bacterium]